MTPYVYICISVYMFVSIYVRVVVVCVVLKVRRECFEDTGTKTRITCFTGPWSGNDLRHIGDL